MFRFMQVKQEDDEGRSILDSVLKKQEQARLSKRIQEILARRNATPKPAPPKVSFEPQPRPAMTYQKPRKRRTNINEEMI